MYLLVSNIFLQNADMILKNYIMLNRTQVFGIDDLIVIGGRNRDSRAEASSL